MLSMLFATPSSEAVAKALKALNHEEHEGKEEHRTSLGCSTGRLIFHNHLTMYFDAHPVEQYRGGKVSSLDEAIIYTPNGRKSITMTVSELKNFVDELSNDHSD